METAIGVFAARDSAEAAVKDLIAQGVPQQSIVFLTRAQSESKTVGKEVGATVGGFVGGAAGLSAGVAAATMMLVPGIGQVFALGFGAAALLGLVGAGTGAALGNVASDATTTEPTADEKCPDDVAFFREVLQHGRSLIVVRTDSSDIARKACSILDRLGLGIQGHVPLKMQIAMRQLGAVTVLDVSGRITLGEGNTMLREIVHDLLDKGAKQILLNLGDVQYIDSSGLGELVRVYTTVRTRGGEMKLVNLSKRVRDLLQMTRLYTVFRIESSEAAAIDSFGGRSQAIA